jgi:hypothetical protein
VKRNLLARDVNKGLSIRQIAKKTGYSYTDVKHWLNKYGLKTGWHKRKETKIPCRLCSRMIFGYRRIRCNSCTTKMRRYRVRLRAIDVLGGKCERCGWQGPPSGFDFHHKYDMSFRISCVANKSWELVKKELEKCELLCATCHRVHHAEGYEDSIFMEEVGKYKGRLLQ